MIIWLSSYPKSGNTWVRSLIASILYSEDGTHSFKNMNKIKQYPLRNQFKNLISNFHDINQIKKNWILSQDEINLDQKIKLFKTHHVNCKLGTDAFTNLNNTLGVIYIVRDPRNIISSIKNHYSLDNYEKAKKMLFTKNQAIGTNPNENKEKNFLTLIGSWGTHYNSWKNTKKNFLLIRYEDLIINTEKELRRIIEYLKIFFKINVSDEKIIKAINTTSFNSLKNMEKKGLFKENAFDKKTGERKNFFNLGPNNNWHKLLDKKIAKEIEEKFKNEMKELGYIN